METFEEFVKNDLLEKCRSAILNNFQFLEDDMKVREFKKLYLDKEKLQKQISQLQQEKEDLIEYLEYKIEKREHEIFKQRQLGVLTPKSNHQLLCEARPYREILSKLKESDSNEC